MINKALFEEENLYIVGESHLCEETYAAIRKTIENNQAVGVLAGYYDRDLTIAYISEFFLHNLGYTYEEFMEKFSGNTVTSVSGFSSPVSRESTGLMQ